MKLIYTVNLNGYDTLKPVLHKESAFDYIVFTDDPKLKVHGWKTVVVKKKKDHLKFSRELKINIHKFVAGYSMYIYIDANFTVNKPLGEYAARYFKGGLLVHKHGVRDCIYQEALEVEKIGSESKEILYPQMREYSRQGMPKNFGLTRNGFFIRDNSVNGFMEKWYAEIEKHSYRDQISLPYVIWKYRPSNLYIIEPIFMKRYLILNAHKTSRTLVKNGKKQTAPRVWYFTPGRGDKNLGQSYNDHCALAGPDDWICVRDGDTIFLNPYWPKQIEDIIIKHGDRYPLISCYTNRLGLEWQLPYGFSENSDILHHTKLADKHYQEFYDEVITSPRETAGLFMLFPKSTWDKVKFEPGLTNGGTFIDWAFANAVMTKLGRIGIAKGIYLFHFYRFNRKNKRDYEHLL